MVVRKGRRRRRGMLMVGGRGEKDD